MGSVKENGRQLNAWNPAPVQKKTKIVREISADQARRLTVEACRIGDLSRVASNHGLPMRKVVQAVLPFAAAGLKSNVIEFPGPNCPAPMKRAA